MTELEKLKNIKELFKRREGAERSPEMPLAAMSERLQQLTQEMTELEGEIDELEGQLQQRRAKLKQCFSQWHDIVREVMS
ncbi:hypothetical protein [Azotosporobacter soli]|uniref:hypothetical protein n=1 Tax=Azotosporobacter soli TaxID=3055040 RepID=UPI0031FEC421